MVETAAPDPENAAGAAWGRVVSPPGLPAEHAILGLLAISGRPVHGYDLAREFRPGSPLGDIIRLEPAMLYKHLKKLERFGWLEQTVEEQVSRPPRRLCQLTSAGEAELRRWLREPVSRTRELRLAFLVKLFFASQLEPALAVELAVNQRDRARVLVASMTRQLAEQDHGAGTSDTGFHRLVLELRRSQTLGAAEWLDRVIEWANDPTDRNDDGSGAVRSGSDAATGA